MDQKTFEDTLRKYLRRKPFYPFQVELLDGKVILVDHPSVAFDGGAATFLTEDDLVEFACEEARDIRTAPAEVLP